jgi:hypothetical protein
MMQKIIRNMCKCRKCDDVIESTYRHDYVSCKCGAIFTDGGTSYIRRGAVDLNDIIDLSTTYEDDANV